MTVSSTQAREIYACNGVTTVRTVPFRILDETHLRVVKYTIATGATVDLVLDTDYTVSDVGAANATFTTIGVDSPYTSAVKLIALRNVPFSQAEDYVANDAFPAESHEEALDKATMILQQLKDVDSRCAVLPEFAPTNLSVILPIPDEGYGLVWDDDTGTLRNTTAPLSDLEGNAETVADNIASVNAVAGISANVTTVAGISSAISTLAAISSDITDAANNIPKANRTAVVAPTANDDVTLSYSEGSLWINTAANTAYICLDPTDGAAVWQQVTTASPLSDGDKGDITVSSSGEVWTIDAATVTAAKMSSGAATNGQVATANGSGGVAYTTISGGGGIPNGGYATNRYYWGGTATGVPAGTFAVTVNRLYFVPFVVGASETFTRIGIEVTTLAAGAARLGIYNFANGVPTTLVLDAGTVNTGTTGEKEVTISQALTAGIYALAVVFNATPTVQVPSFDAELPSHFLGEADGSPSGTDVAGYRAFTYAALPDPFGSLTAYIKQGDTAYPSTWLRKV